MDGKESPKKIDNRYTIKSLRLDLESARAGKTWKLLPEGFRDHSCGTTYPLPSRRVELQKLASIFLPHNSNKPDCGCVYIRRAIKKWKKQQERATSVLLDVGRRQDQIARSHNNYDAMNRPDFTGDLIP